METHQRLVQGRPHSDAQPRLSRTDRELGSRDDSMYGYRGVSPYA